MGSTMQRSRLDTARNRPTGIQSWPVAMLGVFILVYLVWQATRVGSLDPVAVGDLSFVVALGLAMVATEGAARRTVAVPRLARSWHLLTVGLGCYLVANLVQAYREVVEGELSYPSLADALYLSFYGFFFIALTGFATGDRTRRQRLTLGLDVLIVALPAAMVLWYVEMGKAALTSGQAWITAAVSIAYPVGDLMLVAAGTSTLLRGLRTDVRRPFVLLMSGVGLYVLTDLVYAYIVNNGEYHGGDLVDVGWMMATGVFCIAGAVQPVVTATQTNDAPPEAGKRVSPLPYAAIAVGFGLLLVSERDQAFFPDRSLTLSAAVLAAAVAARQLIAQRALSAQQSRNGELVDQLRHQAFHDSLTGLANRTLLTERLQHALTMIQRSGPVAVLMLDLDHFKTVNDTLGHTEGDRLLVVVGERLQRSVRTGDTVARFGGDEFALVLEDLSDPTDALVTADRIVASLQRPITLDAGQVTISASVGVALALDIAPSADDLLRDADTAMYAAKNGGRNRYRVYEPNLREGLSERAALSAALPDAWVRGEISVVYQPIVGLDGSKLTGFEALARWQHPHRGSIPPGVFIPLAEELGLIHQLDTWVLEQACVRARSWNHDYPHRPPLDIHVNVAAQQLLEPTFVAEVRDVLHRTGLPPAQLTLELTESCLIAETQDVADRLAQLKDLGLRLAIDDFGTGYSSLSYLQRLPIDVLKIDRSFINGMGESATGAALVHAILQLGAALEVAVVAEGIETDPQLRQLQEDGCPQGQGFLFSRAIPEDDIDDYITRADMTPVIQH